VRELRPAKSGCVLTAKGLNTPRADGIRAQVTSEVEAMGSRQSCALTASGPPPSPYTLVWRCPPQNRASGLLPRPFFPCVPCPLWRKRPSLFVSKSTLFRKSRTLADPEGRWDLCPVPSATPAWARPLPERHSDLRWKPPSPQDKGSPWDVGWGMKGSVFSCSPGGPGRKLAVVTTACELFSGKPS
jgi:hypothetical protein